MKLVKFKILKSPHFNGMFDGLSVTFRDDNDYQGFDPFCLVGPNGSGKSQFLEILSEAFQSIIGCCFPNEERFTIDSLTNFEIEYAIDIGNEDFKLVRITKLTDKRGRPDMSFFVFNEDWDEVDQDYINKYNLAPLKIIGYTSGANETLSIPYINSRGEYSEEVREQALSEIGADKIVSDTRLMLIDYNTHLELLVSNLLLGTQAQRSHLLDTINLGSLHSFRCVIQLAHSQAPKTRKKTRDGKLRAGVHLTKELDGYIENLKRCATCYNYDQKTETYHFDFKIDSEMETAFGYFWQESLDLYSSFHKLYMLNDLIISRKAREKYRNASLNKRFTSKLPEPQEEDKVFRFEEVKFTSKNRDLNLDYISLSDGEHQFSQILGVFSIFYQNNLLFILDEPESHFNPQWRTKFISKILELPTKRGLRNLKQGISQECIMTSHSPFVPSDLKRERVLIFKKDANNKIRISRPGIETYGSNFDSILRECFNVDPPISNLPQKEIEELLKSTNVSEIKESIEKFGDSVEKTYLVDRVWELEESDT